jgi:hypothetical protein
MKDKPKPYYKNVSGDFYVEDGCCITCMVPEFYAPDLMSFDESNSHCFVAKQPSNADEIYQAIKATWAAEVECIRYGGSDTEILRRLAEAGLSERCDEQKIIQKIKPLLRNHVVFECAEIKSVNELAQQIKDYILALSNEYIKWKVSRIKTDNLGVTFSFSWYEDKFYSLWFNKIESINTWYIFHSLEYEEIGSRAISLLIDDWIRSNKNSTNVKWLANKNWNKSLTEWQATPF